VELTDLSALESPGPWLDPRVDAEVVEAMEAHGYRFTRDGWVDTGLGSIVLLHPDGRTEAGMCDADAFGAQPEWR
jgi:hypothetical protein